MVRIHLPPAASPLRTAAQILDVFERYVDETYRHMWPEPKKLAPGLSIAH